MKENVGLVDKIIRFLIVTGFLVLAWYYGAWYWYILAWVLTLTITLSYCPLYDIIRVDTAKKK